MIEAVINGILAALGTIDGVTITGWEGLIEQARARGRVAKLPAIVVIYEGGPIEPKGQAGWSHAAQIRVQVGSRHLRSAREAAIGAHDLVTLVLARVAGFTSVAETPWLRELVPTGIEAMQLSEVEGGMFQVDVLLRADIYITPEFLTDNLEEIRATLSVSSADVATDIIEIEQ